MSTTPEPAPHLSSRLIERTPFYYGWIVLAASTVGMAMTIPGQTVGVSVFLDSIITDLGLGRPAISGAYMVGTLLASLALPRVGRHIDRVGPRRAVVVISVLFALACGFMGLVSGFVGLLVGFTLIRGLGQGALTLVSIQSINLWFVRRRGLAVGIAGFGFAAAVAVLPIGLNSLISLVGWRWAYAILGIVVAAVMIPVGGGLFRQRPELYGLVADPRRAEHRKAAVETHYRPEQARRTLTFWLYTTGGFFSSALGTGLVFHHFSIMAENGVDRSTAGTMLVTYGVVLALSTLVTGLLLDRVLPRFVLSGALGLLGASLLLAGRVSTPVAVLVYGAVLGWMQGTSAAIQSTVYGHYFGRLHFGAIKGLSTTIGVAGTAAGPFLLAVGFDLSNSYIPVLTLAAVLPLLGAIAVPFIRLVNNGVIR